MKLLVITQVLHRQDAVLGFFVRWVEGLASEVDQLRVVALDVQDDIDLPANCDTRCLGRKGKLGRFLKLRGILREAFADGFDTVLSHMVPRYTLLSHGPARRAGAAEFLWYTHGAVDKRLLKAIEQVQLVFTASERSMRVDTPKRVVTGHGIDLEHFTSAVSAGSAAEPLRVELHRLLSVGRLTPAKDPLTILGATQSLVESGLDVQLELVGGGLASGDVAFRQQVDATIEAAGLSQRVQLLGHVPYPEIPKAYHRASVVINASHTGSIDKVVLEALACGRPAVSCNDSFLPFFAEAGEHADRFWFTPGDAQELEAKLRAWLELDEAQRAHYLEPLREAIARDHEVDTLMRRLVGEMSAGMSPKSHGRQ